mmetsp:Transcript_84722/g.263570  ORF Transcript_84722/g.263570 Transcript_84722/m.263570 type:complete len:230 (+) Transcript_84722:24-713(+)
MHARHALCQRRLSSLTPHWLEDAGGQSDKHAAHAYPGTCRLLPRRACPARLPETCLPGSARVWPGGGARAVPQTAVARPPPQPRATSAKRPLLSTWARNLHWPQQGWPECPTRWPGCPSVALQSCLPAAPCERQGRPRRLFCSRLESSGPKEHRARWHGLPPARPRLHRPAGPAGGCRFPTAPVRRPSKRLKRSRAHQAPLLAPRPASPRPCPAPTPRTRPCRTRAARG